MGVEKKYRIQVEVDKIARKSLRTQKKGNTKLNSCCYSSKSKQKGNNTSILKKGLSS
jgi:hypothetical protein